MPRRRPHGQHRSVKSYRGRYDFGLPGLIPSGRGDDQDHAERGDVGPPRAPAAAPETPDQAPLPRPPPLPRGRVLARVDRRTVARLMNWRTAYCRLQRWTASGVWDRIIDALRAM